MMTQIDLKFLKAADMLGILSSTELVGLAKEALAEPIDELVLELALCTDLDEDCINRTKEKLYEREGLQNLDKKVALLYFAEVICRDISSGKMEPLRGANRIFQASLEVTRDDFHLLDPFIYATSEVQDRPEDSAFFREAIRREADLFIARNAD